jgi:hypothetical protein
MDASLRDGREPVCSLPNAACYTPAVIKMAAGRKARWRVANAAADTIIDVQLTYDGIEQPPQLVGSQDATGPGTPLYKIDIRIPTAGRAEFIVIGRRQT